MSEEPTGMNTQAVPNPPDAFASRYPAVGADLGRYKNLQVLGEGGMARVYRARDPELDLDIAVKVLPRGIQVTQESRQRFRNEVQLLAGITIPGVIRVYDCGEADGWQYFTMELIDGPTLTEYVKTNDPSLERKLQIANQLAKVLGKLHAQDVVHRDLKPSNVMIRDDGKIVLTDFGIAKSFAPEARLDLTSEDTRQGTPFYMSPDRPSELKDLDIAKKADVYSLAVLTYEMLTGKLPYDVHNLTPHECLTVIREEPPEHITDHVEDVPDTVAVAVMGALAKPHTERPDIHAFADMLAAQSVARTIREKNLALPLALILVALVLIIFGLVALHQQFLG